MSEAAPPAARGPGADPMAPFRLTDFGVNAVFGTTQSCSHRRQVASNSGVGSLAAGSDCFNQYSRTMSYGDLSSVSPNAPITSWAVRPPYNGARMGWTIDTVPSWPRTSLHDSRKCVSGICQWQRADVSFSWELR